MSKVNNTVALGKSQADTLTTIDNESWNRDADATVFRLNCGEDVNKDDFFDGSIRQWIVDSNVDLDNTVFEGPINGRRFVLRLNHADVGIRIRFAAQLRSGLRNGNQWKDFFTKSGKKLYIDIDKNARRQREEGLCKKVLRQLGQIPNKAHVDKRAADSVCVRVDGKLLVRISQPIREKKPNFIWDNVLAKSLGLNPVVAEAKAVELVFPDNEAALGPAECL